VGDLFGTLIDQHHHQMAFRIVAGDRVGDVLHDRGLTGLRRRHLQPAAEVQPARPLGQRERQARRGSQESPRVPETHPAVP
ncbi:hypothetical protein C6A85_09635, partial [Mycobacterium sp. ITM-2017-0098]